MKQDGLLLGWLCHGCILHCAANFSRVWLLTILWDWCLSREVVVLLHRFDSFRWFQQCPSLGGCEEVCGVVLSLPHGHNLWDSHLSLCMM